MAIHTLGKVSGESASAFGDITSDFLKRSPLAPGLFMYFFNDLENGIVNRIIKFVDKFNLLKRIKIGALMKDRFRTQYELGNLKAVRNELKKKKPSFFHKRSISRWPNRNKGTN